MRTKKELKKEIFALDPSALPDHIEVGDVVTNLIAGAPTLAMLNPQTGVKAGTTAQLNILTSDVTWTNSNCQTAETGDNTVITDRNITTTRINDREINCLDVMDAKLPMYMAAGAHNEDTDIAQIIIEEKQKRNSKQLEKLVWRGDTAGSGNLSLTDGYLKIAQGETGDLGYYQAYGAGDLTGIANFAADPIGAVKAILKNRTDELYDAEEVCLWMSLPNMNLLADKIRDTYGLDATASFVNTGDENRDGKHTFKFPGTNLIIKGTHGLNGGDDLFCTYEANLRYATDLESDLEEVDVFYDKFNKAFVTDIVFAIGFNYQDPSQVLYVPAP